MTTSLLHVFTELRRSSGFTCLPILNNLFCITDDDDDDIGDDDGIDDDDDNDDDDDIGDGDDDGIDDDNDKVVEERN